MLRYLFLSIVLAACGPIVPATQPPQLDHTPGAFIRFDDERLETPTFSVRVPQGWRVIRTSPAIAPMTLVFAAADDTLQITISAAPLPDATPEPTASAQHAQHMQQTTVDLGTTRVYLRAQGPTNDDDRLRDAFERVRTSLRPVP